MPKPTGGLGRQLNLIQIAPIAIPMSIAPQLDATLAAWATANTPVAVAVCDHAGVVLQCNPAFAGAAQRPAESIIGLPIGQALSQSPKSPLNLAVKRAQQQGKATVVVSFDGGTASDEQQWHFSIEVDPRASLLFVMGSDLSREARLSAEVQAGRTHDRLTGLENRDALKDELTIALSSEQPVALYIADIDGFTEINDTFGHDFGDAVLLVVAQRLRRIAGRRSFVARMGGDQFALMTRRQASSGATKQMAQKLHSLLSGEMAIKQTLIHLELSIGYSVSADGTDDKPSTAGDLIREADTALSRAAGEGGNKICAFHPRFLEELCRRTKTEADLRLAVGTPQLDADAQGLFDIKTRQLLGFEALARWRHPERGTVPPDEFIDVADRYGMLDDVLRAVLDRSLEATNRWLAADPARHLSVNVAPSQLFDPTTVDIVRDALTIWGVSPRQLVVEITERELVTDEVALNTLNQLRSLGVELAIDDFGAGASSLGYLWTIPVSILKLDRRLTNSITSDSTARRIVAGLVGIAADIDLRVVAEGVETEEELKILTEIGCPIVQGFLLHRPCPIAELGDLLGDSNVSSVRPAAASGQRSNRD